MGIFAGRREYRVLLRRAGERRRCGRWALRGVLSLCGLYWREIAMSNHAWRKRCFCSKLGEVARGIVMASLMAVARRGKRQRNDAAVAHRARLIIFIASE